LEDFTLFDFAEFFDYKEGSFSSVELNNTW